MNPEGSIDIFQVDTGFLQGNPLALFYFIICLDYTFGTSILSSNRLKFEKRESHSSPRDTDQTCSCRRYHFGGSYDQQSRVSFQ